MSVLFSKNVVDGSAVDPIGEKTLSCFHDGFIDDGTVAGQPASDSLIDMSIDEDEQP